MVAARRGFLGALFFAVDNIVFCGFILFVFLDKSLTLVICLIVFCIMKKYVGIIGSCTAFFAAGVSAETYYYTGAQQSNSFVSHYEDWSTFNEEFQAYEVATGPIPIDEIGGAETILRRMDTIECLTKGQLAGIDSATAYVKSIIYETSQQLESQMVARHHKGFLE